jgi:hypothetical protein
MLLGFPTEWVCSGKRKSMHADGSEEGCEALVS